MLQNGYVLELRNDMEIVIIFTTSVRMSNAIIISTFIMFEAGWLYIVMSTIMLKGVFQSWLFWCWQTMINIIKKNCSNTNTFHKKFINGIEIRRVIKIEKWGQFQNLWKIKLVNLYTKNIIQTVGTLHILNVLQFQCGAANLVCGAPSASPWS